MLGLHSSISKSSYALCCPAEGYCKKVSCDYTAAWRDGTINPKEQGQWKSMHTLVADKRASEWSQMQLRPALFLTLAFPVCTRRLSIPSDIILFLWLVWPPFVFIMSVPNTRLCKDLSYYYNCSLLWIICKICLDDYFNVSQCQPFLAM